MSIVLKKDIEGSPFWSLSGKESIEILNSDMTAGIGEDEAVRRLEIFGPNVIDGNGETRLYLILAGQFKSPLILILLLAVVITIAISHYKDAAFIFAAIIINASLGFYQEYKAEKALADLKTYLKQRARVVRDGREYEIDVSGLVPGDIIRLSQGDRIPADARLLYVNDFQTNEAVLTGEPLPVVKGLGSSVVDTPIGDQSAMVFAGTLVAQGIGTAVICRTNLSTELGKIVTLVAGTRREETPLQKSIDKFGLRIGVFLGLLTVILFFVGVVNGYSKLDMFLTSVAIAVSAVPEGLPIAMTVILAVGVQRMARRKGVIRKLLAAEALGSTTLILTDKTGTLTKAKMELDKVIAFQDKNEDGILRHAILGTNVLVENKSDNPLEWRMSGRLMETSLVRSAAIKGVSVEEARSGISIINTLPFNSVNKFTVSLIREHGKHLLVFFGAPDIFVEHSTMCRDEKDKLIAMIDSLAYGGYLVMGVAVKEVEYKGDFTFERDLKLTHLSLEGLITLRDPIRSNVKQTMARIENAGIRTVIMTGDHRGTAEAVAREVGIFSGDSTTLDAVELAVISDEVLKARLSTVRVISRVSPSDKMRIVRVFQEMGEVVAMTGDGVNDAPSIKQADIGIAMGSGTDVARDVADLVLLDDNFETISSAVEEGRQIMQNIRKVIVYLLSDTADELFLIGGAIVTGLPLPLNALQILWVNFFSDSFPAVAFAFEKDADPFSSRPSSIKAGLFDPLMKFLILFIGISTSAFLFILYWYLLTVGYNEDIVRTFIFASFGSYTLFLAFSVRSLDRSILKYPLFSNKYLVASTGLGFLLLFSGVYVPFLQSLLGTVYLPVNWLLGVFLIGLFNIVAIEFGKFAYRKMQK